jgi:hypothetical protein
MSCARRLRSAQTLVLKWVVVTITGTRPADVFEDGAGQELALVVREHELLGKIRQDADAVRARLDHEIDAALLAREVQLARFR